MRSWKGLGVDVAAGGTALEDEGPPSPPPPVVPSATISAPVRVPAPPAAPDRFLRKVSSPTLPSASEVGGAPRIAPLLGATSVFFDPLPLLTSNSAEISPKASAVGPPAGCGGGARGSGLGNTGLGLPWLPRPLVSAANSLLLWTSSASSSSSSPFFTPPTLDVAAVFPPPAPSSLPDT
jgi:hypothetical protein